MSQLEQTVARYRSLRLSASAYELTKLLAEAEANKMSYLSFADRLAEHELVQRQDKRIRRNRKNGCVLRREAPGGLRLPTP